MQKTEVRMSARSAARMVARVAVDWRKAYRVTSSLVGVDLLWAWHCRGCDRVGTEYQSKRGASVAVRAHVRGGHK